MYYIEHYGARIVRLLLVSQGVKVRVTGYNRFEN